VVAVALLGASLAATFPLGGPAPGTAADPAYSIAVIDPTSDRVVDRVTVGLLPSAIATGAGNVWVLNQGDTTVSKVDPVTRRVKRTIPLSASPVGGTAIAFGHGAVWVCDGNAATVTRVDPLGSSDPPVRIHARFESDVLHLATGAGAVWVVSARRSTVYRLDPVTRRITGRVKVPGVPGALTVGEGAVWVVSVRPVSRRGELATSGTLTRIDPTTLRIVPVPLPFPPSEIAFGFGAVWVSVGSQNAVLRIDPRTDTVERTIGVGDGPTGIAVWNGSIWVVNAKSLTISRIDPVTNAVVTSIPVASTPGAIAGGLGSVWVAGA